jgi:hypothetical protein
MKVEQARFFAKYKSLVVALQLKLTTKRNAQKKNFVIDVSSSQQHSQQQQQ